MNSTLEISSLADKINGRHKTILEIAELSRWQKERIGQNLTTHLVPIDPNRQGAEFMGEESKIIFLVCRKDLGLIPSDINSISLPLLFSQVSKRMTQAEQHLDYISYSCDFQIATLSYNGKLIVPRITIDNVLGFNFISIYYQGGKIKLDEISSTIYKSDESKAFESLILIKSPQLNALELRAEEVTSKLTASGLFFKPMFDLPGKARHHAERAIKHAAHKAKVNGRDAPKKAIQALEKGGKNFAAGVEDAFQQAFAPGGKNCALNLAVAKVKGKLGWEAYDEELISKLESYDLEDEETHLSVDELLILRSMVLAQR